MNKTTTVMKQTEENGEKKQSLFNNHGPLCFVHLFVKSQLTFYQVYIVVVSPPLNSSYTHQRPRGWGRKKTKPMVLSAKPRLAEYWSPPYTFIQICTFLPPNIFVFYFCTSFSCLNSSDLKRETETSLPHTAKRMHHRLTSAQYRV